MQALDRGGDAMSRFTDSFGLRAGLIAAVLLAFGVSLAADWVVPSAEARGFRRSRFRSPSRSWRRSSRSYRSRRSSRSSSRRARRRPSYRKRTTTRTRRTTRRRTYSNYNTGSTGRRMRRLARNQRRINRRYRSSRSLSTTARWDRYQRAQSRGLVFATTALAVAHYLRVTRPEQYPVQFNTRPTTHPSYLPSSALHKGKSYPVVWSASARRYMLKVGDTLVPYEPLKDTVFIQRGMEQAGYFIGTRPPRPRVRSRASGAASLLGVIFLLLIIVALAVIVWRLKKRFSSGGAQPNRRGRGVVKAPGPPRQHDPDHSDYWLQVEVGDMLSVNDMQAWTDMLKAANASTMSTVRSALRMNTWRACGTPPSTASTSCLHNPGISRFGCWPGESAARST